MTKAAPNLPSDPLKGTGNRFPSRRGALLGALGLAAAAALPAVAMAARHPDARLIALCNSFIQGEDEYERLSEPYYATLEDQPSLAEQERIKELVDRFHRIRALVVRIPARTTDGLRAKAAMVERDLRCACLMPECVTEDEELMPYYTFARDTLALLGARA